MLRFAEFAETLLLWMWMFVQKDCVEMIGVGIGAIFGIMCHVF